MAQIDVVNLIYRNQLHSGGEGQRITQNRRLVQVKSSEYMT